MQTTAVLPASPRSNCGREGCCSYAALASIHAVSRAVTPASACLSPATPQALRRKAEERNPDEFYFAMERSETRDGVHVARSTEANKYTQEELRLMKTQDQGYLALKAQAEAKVGVLGRAGQGRGSWGRVDARVVACGG